MAPNLRSKLIKLAHTNPELRKDLLPLLKTSSFDVPKTVKESLDKLKEVQPLMAGAIRETTDGELSRDLALNYKILKSLVQSLDEIDNGLGPRGKYMRSSR